MVLAIIVAFVAVIQAVLDGSCRIIGRIQSNLFFGSSFPGYTCVLIAVYVIHAQLSFFPGLAQRAVERLMTTPAVAQITVGIQRCIA